MNNDEIKPEFKTIRISAVSYYKLMELTGLFSALSGKNISLTEMGDSIISFCHLAWYPGLIDQMSTPKKREIARAAMQEGLNNWYDALKDVKIRK